MDFLDIKKQTTKVTNKRYRGFYGAPKTAQNKYNQHEELFFAQRAKKASAKCQSSPQELEVSLRSGLYLLVTLKAARKKKIDFLNFYISLCSLTSKF